MYTSYFFMGNNMILTKELLHQCGACENGIDFCERNKLFGFDLDRIDDIQGDYEDYIAWIRSTIINENWIYDQHGNLIKEKLDNNVIFNYTGGIETISIFDERGNKISDKAPDGWWVNYEYDERNNRTMREYSDGKITKWFYNDNNNIIKTQWLPVDFEVINEYDVNNNLITVTDSRGYVITYEYDSNNNCTHELHSNGYWVKNKYDEIGRLISIINSTGISNTMDYDENGNKIYECRSRYINGFYTGICHDYWEYDDHTNLIMYKTNRGQQMHTVEYYDNGQLKRYDDLYIPYIEV